MTLPSRIVACYANIYDNAPAISALPDTYNLIYSAFAIGDGSGSGVITFTPLPGRSVNDFKADIIQAHARGAKVLLSIGGQDDGGLLIQTTTHANQAVSSLAPIISAYGFDGVDIDMENNQTTWTIAAVKTMADTLKTNYGSDFIISCAPQPSITAWKQWAQQMGTNLDLFGMQFYDYPATDSERIAGIKSRIDESIGTYSIPASALMIGCRTVNPSSPTLVSAPSVYRQSYDNLQATYPALRGAYVWTAQKDQSTGYQFASTFASILPAAPTTLPLTPGRPRRIRRAIIL
jgi:chitinase